MSRGQDSHLVLRGLFRVFYPEPHRAERALPLVRRATMGAHVSETRQAWARRIASEHFTIEREPDRASAYAVWALGFASATVVCAAMLGGLAYHFHLTPRGAITGGCQHGIAIELGR